MNNEMILNFMNSCPKPFPDPNKLGQGVKKPCGGTVRFFPTIEGPRGKCDDCRYLFKLALIEVDG